MKRKIFIIAALFIGATCFLPACDIFDECGKCIMVTVKPDGTETRSAPVYLCDDDLADKQNFIPETAADGSTVYWECN